MTDFYVEKRNGEKVKYNLKKIEDAITKANESLDSAENGKITKTLIKTITNDVDKTIMTYFENIVTERDSLLEKINKRLSQLEKISEEELTLDQKNERKQLLEDQKNISEKLIYINIENIQDIVENTFIKPEYNCIKIAKCYIKYRRDHERYRLRHSDLYKALLLKANAENDEKANANLDENSFGGRIGEVASIIMCELAYDIMSERQLEAFLENEIYPHDRNAYFVGMHNCISVPFDDIINDYGIDTRNTDIRVSNSANTAGQMFAVGGQLQSLQQFGGFSATHTDTTMVIPIRKTYYKNILKARDLLNKMNMWLPKLEMISEAKDTPITNTVYWGKYRIFNKRRKIIAQEAMEWTESEVNQVCEALYHNLNTLQSRSGNQLPFSSLNYGLDTSVEGRMMIKALLRASMEGLGKYHRTSIFPCGIFQLKNGINALPGDPNYDLKLMAIKSTVNRFYPNYFNCDWSVQVEGIKKDRELKRRVLSTLSTETKQKLIAIFKEHPEYAEKINLFVNEDGILSVSDKVQPTEEGGTMGCRTFNGYDVNFDEKYFEQLLNEIISTGKLPKNYLYSAMQKDGRGNIAPSTVIMPTYAMKARLKWDKDKSIDIVEEFMKMLDKAIDDTKDFLIERFEHICSQKPSSARFMYDNDIMKGYIRKQGIRSALKHGTLAVGQLGLAETLQILIGKNHLTEEGMALAERIEQLFKAKCDKYKEEYKLNFGVYFTPAENLCYTAMTKFRNKYKDHPYIKNMIKEGTLREYFTNSIHVPVWEKIDIKTKIDVETRLSKYSSAGCILYIEFDGVSKNNLKAVEECIDYAKLMDAPYIAINIPADVCLDCGFIGDFSDGEKCTKCGSTNILMPGRITGYLNGDWRTSFNYGKQQEKKDREKQSLYTFNTIKTKSYSCGCGD